MGPRHLLQMALLLVAQAVLPEASLYCIHLEYWSPDNKSCRSCLELYGPPPSLDHEFEENCGFDDFGNNLRHPFRKCSSGKCNPDGADLCHPCGGGALARTPSSPAGSLPFTAESKDSPPSVAPLLVLVLFLISAVALLLPWQRLRHKENAFSWPDVACGDSDTYPSTSWRSSSPHALQATDIENPGKSYQVWRHSPSRLLEELIMLLDPEPGPGGSVTSGTTCHLAARYGLPAAWSTFADSLRPNHSPLRALIEMVVAREPSASLGQLGTHLAQLGREDALHVLSKLG